LKFIPKVNLDEDPKDKKKKKDDKQAELSEDEINKLKEINKKMEDEWNTYSEDQKRRKEAENITKHSKVVNSNDEYISKQLIGDDLILIEDVVFENKYIEVIIVKLSTVTDKKSKKEETTASLLSLNLNMGEFKRPGYKQLIQYFDLKPINVNDNNND